MKKKVKNSIKEQVVSKSVKVFNLDKRLQLLPKLNEESVTQLANDIMKWACDEEGILKFTQIYLRLGILPMEFHRLAEKYPELARARDFARMAIGTRREIGGLKHEFNAGMITMSMPIYDEEWKEVIAWRADLSTKNQQGYQNIVVQMAPIPSSDLVSVKKSESLNVGDDNA